MLKLNPSSARPAWLFILFFLFSLASSEAQPSLKQKTISAHRAADFIHAVIETDRTIYSQYIVERLGETVSLKASENWEKANTLPLPAQLSVNKFVAYKQKELFKNVPGKRRAKESCSQPKSTSYMDGQKKWTGAL